MIGGYGYNFIPTHNSGLIWRSIIGYALIWPILGLIISVGIAIYLMTGWVFLKKSNSWNILIPNKTW